MFEKFILIWLIYSTYLEFTILFSLYHNSVYIIWYRECVLKVWPYSGVTMNVLGSRTATTVNRVPDMGQPTKPLTNNAPVKRSMFEHVKIEHMVAGFSGGVASTLILHPLDLLKIRFAGE